MKPYKNRPMKLDLDGKQRLNKVLAAAGYGSRRSVDELIEQGRVEINGETCSKLGTQVDPATDKISVDGELIKLGRPTYYAVNKPIGVVCTNRDPQGRPRVVDLVPQGARLFSIGRLDRNSTGLILLTNDGTVAQRLTHPKYGVRKTYRVLVAGSIDRDQLGLLRKGVYLAEGRARADDATIRKQHKNSTELEIVLSEGKNREIRRILARIGHKVLALQRTSVGPIKLANLAEGDFRPLTGQEIDSLKKTAIRLSEGKSGLREEKGQKEKAVDGKTSRVEGPVDSKKSKPKKRERTDEELADIMIPEQLSEDARFITDPSQIPSANWDDDFEVEADSIVDSSVDEDLSPELEAELEEFFQGSEDDDDGSDELNPFMEGEDDDDDLATFLEDAVLVKDSDSPRKGRVIADSSEEQPAAKERRGPKSKGSSVYGQFNKAKPRGFKGKRDSERGEGRTRYQDKDRSQRSERSSDRNSPYYGRKRSESSDRPRSEGGRGRSTGRSSERPQSGQPGDEKRSFNRSERGARPRSESRDGQRSERNYRSRDDRNSTGGERTYRPRSDRRDEQSGERPYRPRGEGRDASKGDRSSRPRSEGRDEPRGERGSFPKGPRGNSTNPWKQGGRSGGPKRAGGAGSAGRPFKGKPNRRPRRED